MILKTLRYIFIICATSFKAISVQAADPDTLMAFRDSITLQNVEVKGARTRSHLRSRSGTDIISMSLMTDMPKILGNADPMHYAQLLPGIQTNSEYDAGMHIHGCDNSHNMVAMNGVPIYNAGHLLGFFSVFNSAHFSEMQISKSCALPSAPNRLGGMVDMHSWQTLKQFGDERKPHGELSAGPMSAQGTVKTRIGKKAAIAVSAREAYINMLYSRWLKVDDSPIRYAFGDYNITYIWQPDNANSLRMDAYYGHDNFRQKDKASGFSTALKWNNAMASACYTHRKEGFSTEHTLYYTRYWNRLNIDETTFHAKNITYIADTGYKMTMENGGWKGGAELTRHRMQPQNPQMEGNFDFHISREPVQTAVEGAAYATYGGCITQALQAEAGVRLAYFNNGGTFTAIDPGLKIKWAASASSTLTLNAGIRHQYLYQGGFSTIGLPIEFWFAASSRHRPQYACNLSLQNDTWIAERHYRLSAEIYCKQLRHIIENRSNLLDLLFSSYSLDASVIHGKGYNYGLNILLEKRRGRLTGWLSYSLGRAWREFDGTEYNGRFPASHERIHELNAVATLKVGKRWSFGSTFVCASGTPYTRIKHIYMFDNNIVSEYGKHNGSRVNTYLRLDLSANYDLSTKGSRRSGINISLYNATAHNNDLFYRFHYNLKMNQIEYNAFRFAIPLLPSINYYCYF